MSRAQILASLASQGLDPIQVESLVRAAIAEDLDGGVDVTTVATVPVDQQAELSLVAHAAGVIAGIDVAALVFDVVAGEGGDGRAITAFDRRVDDGSTVNPGEVLLTITGRTRDLLTAERTALNLLGHLSGVATETARWAVALGDSGTQVRDTRKTMPLLRSLEKYAVRCGGGVNHRMSLSDAALVKDNHVVAAGGVAEAFAAVRSQFPGLPVEVEVDALDQLEAAVAAGADLVLLDNFTVDQLRAAVVLVAGRARLEASGGLTLRDAAEVASTGVDFVAVGALTHSAPTLDIGADLRAL